jgi:RecB family exonuclease
VSSTIATGPGACGLVVGSHPAVEGDAVVGALAAMAESGVAWHHMAVVAPPGARRLAAIARSARRSGVPLHATPGPRLEGGFVERIVETVLTNGHPAGSVWDLCAAALRADDADLFAPGPLGELAAALLRIAHEYGSDAERWAVAVREHPYLWRPSSPVHTDAVQILTWNAFAATQLPSPIEQLSPSEQLSASQQLSTSEQLSVSEQLSASHHRGADEYRFIVATGLVDGIWPRPKHVEADAARFDAMVSSCTEVLAIAAPDAGQLVSRFVEQWPRRPLRRARRTPDQSRFPLGLTPTVPTQPLWPNRSLRLSATQLTTYENCPWSHALQYAATVRSESGLSARFGTLVHEILETFLAAADEPLTRERLFATAEALWDPGIAQYRPQREDYRSRLETLLDSWWDDEGQHLAANPGTVLFTERRFEIRVGPHLLTGSIDRIDAADPAADPPGLSVIDYKTGAMATHAAAEESIQLSTYYLAASTDPELAQLGPVRSLELHYLQSDAANSVRRQHITDGHAERTVERITALADRILAEETSPSTAADCQYCDLQRLCPRQAPGRALPIAFSTESLT